MSISDEDSPALGVTITYEEEALDVIRQRKIVLLKAQRDSAEVTLIEHNGNSFDYDDKARDRINAAIIALDVQGEGASIDWTTANTYSIPDIIRYNTNRKMLRERSDFLC